jgi:hypothetical protein
MTRSKTMTGLVISLGVIGFLPAVIALLRGKIVVAIICGLVVLMATPLWAIMPPIAVILWFVALFVGGLAGRRKVVVIEKR